ncbi:laminin subunit alpha-2 [Elysia marginata]|uniref:Laminin subunit alpha-2 n=1 Tax=Elysia marginata TaxID=1093978 RepID=A0AAV4JJ74_9GAST|nr:laminin subunit alpha-2 [Elysia marginata]
MSTDLTSAQQNYEQFFTTMQDKVDRIKEEIETMENDIEECKSELTNKTPIFKDLEDFYHKRSEEYDAMKKLIVATATSPQHDTLTNHTATLDWTPQSSTQDH